MASPSKAFIDPTGVSLFLDSAVSSVMAPVALFSPARVWILRDKLNDGSPVIGRTLQVLSNQQGKIPPPPMGRMMLATFPPIYRERGSSSNRPLDGQTWPRFAKSGQD